MKINVKQRELAIGAKYDIYVFNQDKPATDYKAASQIFRLLREIKLFKGDDTDSLLTIKKLWSLFIPKYDIEFANGEILEFRTISYWRSHHRCSYNGDVYDIYVNTWGKYSIYKNDIQIAWLDKDLMTVLAGDNYIITADNDCNVELMITFCLVIDDATSRSGNSMTFNMGTIPFLAARKFDTNWRPKE